MKMSAVSRVLHPSLAYARTHNFSLINFHLNASLAVSTVVYIHHYTRVYNKVLDGRQKKKETARNSCARARLFVRYFSLLRAMEDSFLLVPVCRSSAVCVVLHFKLIFSAWTFYCAPQCTIYNTADSIKRWRGRDLSA